MNASKEIFSADERWRMVFDAWFGSLQDHVADENWTEAQKAAEGVLGALRARSAKEACR